MGRDNAGWKQRPLVSVVLPGPTPAPGWLQKSIDSVVGQVYGHWELLIVADPACPGTTPVAVLDGRRRPDPGRHRSAR